MWGGNGSAPSACLLDDDSFFRTKKKEKTVEVGAWEGSEHILIERHCVCLALHTIFKLVPSPCISRSLVLCLAAAWCCVLPKQFFLCSASGDICPLWRLCMLTKSGRWRKYNMTFSDLSTPHSPPPPRPPKSPGLSRPPISPRPSPSDTNVQSPTTSSSSSSSFS